MNSRLTRTLSLAALVLSLSGTVTPATQALADTIASAPGTDQPVKPTDTNPTTPQPAPVKPAAQPSTSKPTPAPEPELPKEPAAGQPGSRIKLESGYTDNTRDLGGYVTADGQWKIADQRLLRSNNLSKLTENDAKTLADTYHVKKVIDMRTNGQIKKAPDKAIPGAQWQQISILGQLADVPPRGDVLSGDGAFYDHRLEFAYSAVTGYHQFLMGLLTQKGATLFHCSSGKDRTGIGAVLIMNALGMDQATIERDYMMSATYKHTVKYAWLKEYFKEIKSHYGNLDNYMTKLLNFGPEQRAQLRAKYLVSTDGKNTPYPAPVVTTPAPTMPVPAPQPVQPTPEKPAVVHPVKPETNHANQSATKPTHFAKPKTKRVVKVLSVKKLKAVRYVHTKAKRAYFYDLKLKRQVGKTAAYSKTKWRVVKQAKIKLNGKKLTLVQIKSPHGHLRWIQASFVTTIH